MPAQKLSNSQTGQGSDDPSDNFVYEDEGTALNGPKKTDLKISVVRTGLTTKYICLL
jgi:hypothetical protein